MNKDEFKKSMLEDDVVLIDETVDKMVNNEKEEKQKKFKRKIFDLDLIKGEIVNIFNFKRNVIIFFIAIILSALIILVVYLGISKWEENQTKDQAVIYAEKIHNINNIFLKTKTEAERIFELQKKMNIASSYLDAHIYQNNFFDFLENNILEDVYFTAYSEQGGGNYTFSAISTGVDFARLQVEKFLQSDYVESASVSAVSISVVSPDDINDNDKEENKNVNAIIGEDEVRFDISVKIKPEVFYKEYKYDAITREK